MFDEANARCPYYKHSAKKSVSCEGVTDDSVIKVMFGTFKQMYRFRRIYCCAKFKECAVYSMLEKKYEK